MFQSPDLSLNPEQRVDQVLGRPLDLYAGLRGAPRERRIAELLATVGLDSDYAGRYPAELSGGEKQRVSIARGLAADPDIILCDEVLSSLDTVVAASILDLMRELRRRLNVAYLFISHDLATVAAIADRVAVLYAGIVCELGTVQQVFSPPHHPYTALLMSSVPALRPEWLEEVLASRVTIEGMESTVVPRDVGCPFRNRCPLVIEGVCDREPPPRRTLAPGHVVLCHRRADELTHLHGAGPPAGTARMGAPVSVQ